MWGSISKFGLKHFDLPTMLWNVTSMLRMLALNIDPRNEKPIHIFTYIHLIVMCACYYYVYLVSMAWFVFWRCRQTGDLLPAIIVFSLGASSEISMTKFLFLYAHRKKVKTIVASYLSCDAEVVAGSRFANNLMTTLRQVKKRAIIVWNVIMWNGIIYVVKPLVTPGRHFMEDVFVFFGLEPMTESPNYEIGLIANIYGVIVTCFPAANVTAFFIVINGYTEAHMLALSHELTNLWADAVRHQETDVNHGLNSHVDIDRQTLRNIGNKDWQKQTNKYVRNRLQEILKSHTRNINLVYRVENVFRGAIAMEFMLLIVGIIAELLGGLENTYIQLPFALMLVGNDCLTGQRIKDASMVFERAVYDSKWENFDVTNRKMVLLMLQNAQKNMKLSAGGVATLSLECLMAVFRMTYSAYTTLRSTMNHA